MAVDTKDRRISAAAVRLQRLGIRRIMPDPDSSIDADERAQLAGHYVGFTGQAQSNAFVINSTEYFVIEGGHSLSHHELTESSRSYGGVMRSALDASSRNRARTWRIETAQMESSDADTLESTLSAYGSISVSGDLISTSAIPCYVENLIRTESPTMDFASFSFDLLEAAP